MISNITKNCLGTASFDGKFGKMRKAQDFVVCAINARDDGSELTIQSEHRYGIIKLATGKMVLSANHANYANSVSLTCDLMNRTAEVVEIPADELEPLLAFVRGTASPMAGNNAMEVYCDNSNADKV